MTSNPCLPCRDICDCITLNSPDESVLISKVDCAWSLQFNPAVIPSPTPGTESIVTAGTAISVTGDGSEDTPYIIANTGVTSVNGSTGAVTITPPTGAETKVNPGTGIQVTGAGTIGSPYVITCTVSPGTPADGSETKVTAGTAISVTGNGTTGTPYIVTNTGVTSVNGSTGAVVVPTYDGSETKVTAGTNVTVTGLGTIASPYIINATTSASACATTILPYTGASCCKSLDTALTYPVVGGLIGSNNTGACTREVKINKPQLVDLVFQTGFSRFVETTGDMRPALDGIYKRGIYSRLRGYMTWDTNVVAVSTTVFSKCITMTASATTNPTTTSYTDGNKRTWYVWGAGLGSSPNTMLPFIIQMTLTTGEFYIKGVPGNSYAGTYAVNLEPVVFEVD